MASPYRIFGAELSPYSVKVRSYFRYKGIPHEWIVRGPDQQAEEFQKYAKLPLIPLVVTPEDEGLQDSTPILEAMEARFPEPVDPPESTRWPAFLSALLEEFGDEWGNKWMFHYRWAREADQNSAAERLARVMAPGLEGDQLAGAMAGVKQRMVDRVWFVGSNEETAPQIEESYQEALGLLEAASALAPVPVRRPPRLRGLRALGAALQLRRRTRRRVPSCGSEAPERWRPGWSACSSPRRRASSSRGRSWPLRWLPCLERQVGRLFLPWSDANARRDRRGQGRVLGRARWTALHPEAPEVPRQVTRRAAAQVLGCRSRQAPRRDPRDRRLPAMARGPLARTSHHGPSRGGADSCAGTRSRPREAEA